MAQEWFIYDNSEVKYSRVAFYIDGKKEIFNFGIWQEIKS
jgi:hypothetical protein